jgi:hypothetical protein
MSDAIYDPLDEFSQACIAVANLLNNGTELSESHRLSLENSLAIVQLKYRLWVRLRHKVA